MTDEFYVFDVYERLGRGIYVNHSIQKRRKSAPPTIIGNEKSCGLPVTVTLLRTTNNHGDFVQLPQFIN